MKSVSDAWQDILGVTSVESVVSRISCQGVTQQHLQQLREASVSELRALEEERDELQQMLGKLKYSTTENEARYSIKLITHKE